MKSLIVLASLLCPAIVASQDVHVGGVGSALCYTVLDNLQTNDLMYEALYRGWAQGYMAGVNIAGLTNDWPQLDLTDHERHWEWLRAYCDDKPQSTLVQATSLLIATLRRELSTE